MAIVATYIMPKHQATTTITTIKRWLAMKVKEYILFDLQMSSTCALDVQTASLMP